MIILQENIMPNISDYLEWRCDIPFAHDPFNDVDNLILAELSYAHFDGAVPADGKRTPLRKVYKTFFEINSREKLEKSDDMLAKTAFLMDGMMEGRRFSGTQISDYVDIVDTDRDMQMSAVTFILEDGTAYIAFRGTDNTIVGWKEDLNLAVKQEVPAQKKAAAYVASIAAKCSGKLIIGGHSKGGNLALYSAIKADKATRDRIESIWNFDGPGFLNSDITKSMHTIFGSRIHTFVPETSVVGMMLNRSENYIPIANLDKKSNFFDQHNLFSWKIEACRFVPVGQVSSTSNVVHATTQSLLQNFTVDQTTQFINVIFDAADKAGLRTVNDLSSQPLKFASSLANCYSSSDKETQKLCKFIVSSMISSASAANKSQKQKK